MEQEVASSLPNDIAWSEPENEPVDHGEEVYGKPNEPYLPNPVPPAEEGPHTSDYFNPDGDWHKTKLGETPEGKEVFVAKRKDGTGYTLRYNKGVMPADIHGSWWTTYRRAEEAGRFYLNKLHSNAQTSAETADD